MNEVAGLAPVIDSWLATQATPDVASRPTALVCTAPPAIADDARLADLWFEGVQPALEVPRLVVMALECLSQLGLFWLLKVLSPTHNLVRPELDWHKVVVDASIRPERFQQSVNFTIRSAVKLCMPTNAITLVGSTSPADINDASLGPLLLPLCVCHKQVRAENGVDILAKTTLLVNYGEVLDDLEAWARCEQTSTAWVASVAASKSLFIADAEHLVLTGAAEVEPIEKSLQTAIDKLTVSVNAAETNPDQAVLGKLHNSLAAKDFVKLKASIVTVKDRYASVVTAVTENAWVKKYGSPESCTSSKDDIAVDIVGKAEALRAELAVVQAAFSLVPKDSSRAVMRQVAQAVAGSILAKHPDAIKPFFDCLAQECPVILCCACLAWVCCNA